MKDRSTVSISRVGGFVFLALEYGLLRFYCCEAKGVKYILVSAIFFGLR